MARSTQAPGGSVNSFMLKSIKLLNRTHATSSCRGQLTEYIDIDIASMNCEPKYFTLQRPRAFKDPQHLSVHDNFNLASGSFNLKIFRNQIIYSILPNNQTPFIYLYPRLN